MRLVQSAFTLIELLVVVTIIVVLLALLTPALDKAIEQAQRAVCGANQKLISSSCVMYALENKKFLFLPRGREVTIAFDPKGTQSYEFTASEANTDWPAALASAGLASRDKLPVQGASITASSATPTPPYSDNLPGKMWDCPSRPGWKSYWAYFALFGNSTTAPYDLLVGYQYLGGLSVWKDPWYSGSGDQMGNPPVARTLGDSGRRALTADVTAKYGTVWGGTPGDLGSGQGWYLADTPPHRDENNRPVGHNQSFLDGAVEWIDASKLFMFHDWNYDRNEMFFYWQEDFGRWHPAENDQSWARNQ